MFRKIGNPKSTLRNNCVGQHHGREYEPYSSRRAVSLARFDGAQSLQTPIFWTLQDGRGLRDVLLTTVRIPSRLPLPLT